MTYLRNNECRRVLQGAEEINDLIKSTLLSSTATGFDVHVATKNGLETFFFEPSSTLEYPELITVLGRNGLIHQDLVLIVFKKPPFKELFGTIIASLE